jgi:hypothetical protein
LFEDKGLQSNVPYLISFQVPNKPGMKFQINLLENGNCLGTMRAMTVDGRTLQSQTPAMNFIAGPTVYYPNHSIQNQGLTPGAFYTISVTTFNVPAPPGCVDFHVNFQAGHI